MGGKGKGRKKFTLELPLIRVKDEPSAKDDSEAKTAREPISDDIVEPQETTRVDEPNTKDIDKPETTESLSEETTAPSDPAINPQVIEICCGPDDLPVASGGTIYTFGFEPTLATLGGDYGPHGVHTVNVGSPPPTAEGVIPPQIKALFDTIVAKHAKEEPEPETILLYHYKDKPELPKPSTEEERQAVAKRFEEWMNSSDPAPTYYTVDADKPEKGQQLEEADKA
ncbi:unnamed protein product, partial [Mesorhabditis spiculigera]